MGGASKLLSSLLLTSSPLRLRPSAASAAALFLSPPAVASRRRLLISSPSPLRTLSTASSAASALPHGSNSSSASPAPPPRAPFPEWSRLVDRLAAAGYASRAPCPADELAHASGCDLSYGAETAVFSCLAFARDQPDLLRSLPRKDVEVLVAKAAPALFKDGEASVRRLQRYLAGEESDVIVSDRAGTVDIVRYLLSYAYCSSDNYSEDKELTDTAVRNILSVLESFSGHYQSSSTVESTLRQTSSSQHEQFSRPPRQNVEMKRGDWICTRCRFMNFARNARCLECNEQRPKKMLTGGEWECPKCDFYNYGKNMSCLRCDCKRPATIPPNPASAGTGLSDVAQLLNVGSVDTSEIERKLAENDEKAERWLSKVSQLDDSADLSSLAEDEDFPEIMPMRKGVNKFVVSTRKTPLERRLANAQYNSNNSPQAASSDSKISQTLDRILGRSTSTAAPNNQSDTGGANAEASKKTDYLGGIDPVPFVPLSPDLFAKPQSSNEQRNRNDAEANSSMTNSTTPLPDRRDDQESLETVEKWSKNVTELDNVKDSPRDISGGEDFPEIMPMRKGENRFVVSKKKDRSLTSPQYKRRSVLEHADNSNFVPFVPFPPDYFAKKDKPVESISDKGTVSEGSPATEKYPETNALSGNSSNTSHIVANQPKGNMNTENWNRDCSQQNIGSSGYAYDEKNNYQHQPQSQGHSWSSSSSSTGTWGTDYSQGTFNERSGESGYNGANYSTQPPYTSGYNNSNNSWSRDNNSRNNAWSGSSNYNNNTTWSGNSNYNNNNAWSGSSNYNNNNAWSGNDTYDNSSAWKGNSSYNNNNTGAWSSNNYQSGSVADSSSGSINQTSYGGSPNRGYTGKSLEGSAVKDPDPLDMSEEAKAERWFRRAAQIKDISELANIPDEDFPEIMPMRKGVNRFVVSKRKTPLERRLTSPQYRRNLPIVSSEPDKDGS
ncbi:hypothetical protein EJB05_18522, partial [Eragrostis curvula]